MSVKHSIRQIRANRDYFDGQMPSRRLAHPSAHKQVKQEPVKMPSKAYCRRWMTGCVEDFIDDCGEVECTQLVEAFAVVHPQCDPWLDDSTHWIWDLPIEIEDRL